MRPVSRSRAALERTRSTALYARVSRYPALLQFVKYGMVGVLNVTVYVGIYNLLRLADVHPNLSLTVAFFFTSIQSYTLNNRWTFRDTGRHPLFRGYMLFVGFTLVGLALNQAAFTFFLIGLRRFGRLGENIALLGATPLSVAWNFMAYRRWTFSSEPSATRAAS